MEKICVLSGAGMSAESGLMTFRDAGGLWEGHDVQEVASIEGWRRNPQVVLDFYNERRRQLKIVKPNIGHLALVKLEQKYDVSIITQNVDNLHERAGSQNVIHLHGRLDEVRPINDPETILSWTTDLNIGDKFNNQQLRPNIVWFGEEVPTMERALIEVSKANHVIIIGTSMQVYPAASLVQFAPPDAQIYYIDPKPSINFELSMRKNILIISQSASTGVPELIKNMMIR